MYVCCNGTATTDDYTDRHPLSLTDALSNSSKKYQKKIGVPAHPATPGLEIVRHYNALDRRPSVLGQGWALSYDPRLFQVGGHWQIVQPDGSRIHFQTSAGKPLANARGTLAADGAPCGWSWPRRQRVRVSPPCNLIGIKLFKGTT